MIKINIHLRQDENKVKENMWSDIVNYNNRHEDRIVVDWLRWSDAFIVPIFVHLSFVNTFFYFIHFVLFCFLFVLFMPKTRTHYFIECFFIIFYFCFIHRSIALFGSHMCCYVAVCQYFICFTFSMFRITQICVSGVSK